MWIEIVDNEVLECEEMETETQTAIIKTGKGKVNKVILTVDKEVIKNDGIDKALISGCVKNYLGEVVSGIRAVKIALNGQVISKNTNNSGIFSIEFSGIVEGVYTISAECPDMDIGIVTIEVVKAVTINNNGFYVGG